MGLESNNQTIHEMPMSMACFALFPEWSKMTAGVGPSAE